MKNRFKVAIICCMFIGMLFAGSAWAGQVVTDFERSWARGVLSQEKTLKTEPVPGTVAVLYFNNQSKRSQWNPLEKGITLMLITDLMSVKGLQVVERVKLQALVEELGLGVSGLVSPGTEPRVGRLLGVSNVISGSILADIGDKFKIIPIYLKIPDGEPLDLTAAEGEVAELFRMEKELLFTIIDKVLKVPLTDQERSRLMVPMTRSVKALFFLFKGIMQSDLGNFSRAAGYYENALKEDPNLTPASEFLKELKSLGHGRGKIDRRVFLKSIRNRTSHTDRLSPDQVVRRERTPVEVERRQDLRPPKPDDVDDDGDGYTENQGDCDDTDATIHPGASEICGDGIDQDCNGSDLSCDNVDNDGDGYTEIQGDCNDGNRNIHPGAVEVCGDGIDQDCNGSDLICPGDVDNDGDGYSPNQGDCDDTNASIHPGATEICGNDIDENCDGNASPCPGDIDSDGDGYTENQGDCNDSDASIHPGATEVCGDDIDQDCNGSDLSCDDVDNDGDGYTENQGDCNDSDATIHPGAAEVCGDDIDQDCNGSDLLCGDVDNDGDGYTENQGDCNDSNPTIHPGATEICGDGIDQDCNGVDAVCPPVDNDKDGYFSDVDCNDNDPNYNPGISCEAEYDNTGNDYNCDGVIGCF